MRARAGYLKRLEQVDEASTLTRGAAEAGSICSDLARSRGSWADGELPAKLRLPQQTAGRHPVGQHADGSVIRPVRGRDARRSGTTPPARGGSSSGETRFDVRYSPPARRF